MINLSNASHVKSVGKSGHLPCFASEVSPAECFELSVTKSTNCMPVDRLAEQQVCGLNGQESEDAEEDEQCGEPMEFMPFLKEMLRGLSDTAVDEAFEGLITRSGEFHERLDSVAAEQQLRRMIEVNGGSVVDRNENFFVVRDREGNSYVIERAAARSRDNDGGFYV